MDQRRNFLKILHILGLFYTPQFVKPLWDRLQLGSETPLDHYLTPEDMAKLTNIKENFEPEVKLLPVEVFERGERVVCGTKVNTVQKVEELKRKKLAAGQAEGAAVDLYLH